jgi:hypothetical protein
MDNNKCKSVKNKRVLYEQCLNKISNNSEFCNYHYKQKNKKIYNTDTLNPLNSLNDIDIISLEKIHYYEGDKKVIAREIKPEYLFTYKITVNEKEFQRTLNILTMKDLIELNLLTEPFSNVPFTSEIITDAKKVISLLKLPTKKITLKEKKNILINNLISKFETIGHIIESKWIIQINKLGYIRWYNEVIYLWKEFKYDNADIAIHIYPSLDLPIILDNNNYIINVLTLFNELSNSNYMGINIVFSALVWSQEHIKQQFSNIL